MLPFFVHGADICGRCITWQMTQIQIQMCSQCLTEMSVGAVLSLSLQSLHVNFHNAALDVEVEEKDRELAKESIPLWRTLVCVFVGITETFCWIAHGLFSLYKDPQNGVLSYCHCLAVHRHTTHYPSDGYTTL